MRQCSREEVLIYARFENGGAILDLGCPSFRPSVFCHNFIFAQYLGNKLIEFLQILYMH